MNSHKNALLTCMVIEGLRRRRHTGKQIAAETGVSPATVSRIQRRPFRRTRRPFLAGFSPILERLPAALCGSQRPKIVEFPVKFPVGREFA
jgi:hypothetical protein